MKTADDYLAIAATAENEAAAHRKQAEQYRAEAVRAERNAKIMTIVVVVCAVFSIACMVDTIVSAVKMHRIVEQMEQR
jgi:hypothetical protein